MNDASDALLEMRIRTTLHERADSFHPVPPGIGTDLVTVQRPRRKRRLVGALAAAATVVVLLVVGTWLVTRTNDRPDVSTDQVDPTPGPADAGVEVPLRDVPTPPGVASWLKSGGRQVGAPKNQVRFGAGLRMVTVRPDDGPPVVLATEDVGAVTLLCVGVPIVQGGTTVSWRSQFCTDSPPPPPEAPPNPDPIYDLLAKGVTTTYLTWLDVPDGTAYTTLAKGSRRAWQRPRHGISVFPVSAVGPIDATVRAFTEDGRLLAEVPIAKPDDGPFLSSDLPPWHDLDAKRRWCDTAPLAEVNRAGRFETIRAFDHGTGGLVEVDAREACKQVAALTPFPLGDLTASFSVVDGRFQAKYHDRVVTVVDGMETHTQGAAVPQQEARAIIAADRARISADCSNGGPRLARLPKCSVPG